MDPTDGSETTPRGKNQKTIVGWQEGQGDERHVLIVGNDLEELRRQYREQSKGIANDPNLWSPKLLPELRMTLLDRWRPGGDFEVAARRLNELHGTPTTSVHDPSFDAVALIGAELWWVTEDMTALIEHAAETLPATTLTDSLVPHDWGLAYFPKPLMGIDSEGSGMPIATSMLLWGRTKQVDLGPQPWHRQHSLGVEFGVDDRSVTVSCYGHPLALPEGPWVPQGRSDWLYGTDIEAPSFTGEGWTDARAQSITEDRRRLAALWLLASQPLAETTGVPVDRAANRRLVRAHPDAPAHHTAPEVRLIDLRRPKRQAAAGSGGVSGRKWSHRTIVSGHWRQQAYGPERSLRRPTWIAEHIAGPDDGPLIVRENVHVVRGSEHDRSPGA